jgi:multidrug resistance efflux pump
MRKLDTLKANVKTAQTRLIKIRANLDQISAPDEWGRFDRAEIARARKAEARAEEALAEAVYELEDYRRIFQLTPWAY